jgi:pimeloyl-ACP methyl ester carboxylesterase
MVFPEGSRFADNCDVVLVGYRGVDGSVRLDCPEVVTSRERSRDWLSTASLEAQAAAFRACAYRLRDEGVDLAGYTIPQRVDELEFARRKLGYGPIDLVSESFGTRLALIWAWRYPGEHPPLGDGRCQSARSLPLGCEDDARADPPLRHALCEGRELPQ